MLRTPPDILITTPESLFLLLTSQARETLRGVETVILDEVHAVAGSKRGAHLALSLERLERLADSAVQRIGLSATQRPLEEIGRFVAGTGPRDRARRRGRPQGARPPGRRPRRGHARARRRPPSSRCRRSRTASRWASVSSGSSRSIWPSIYPAILELVRAHRSTIVFVNNRRLAERLALRINELAEEELARAHHGSLAREQRLVVEELLKAGRDPVPRRDVVARARHRHGRGRPRDPGREPEVGRARAPARRPRRARAPLGLEGPDLPEVPRRPPRVGRRRAGDARGRDRGDAHPAEPARRARAADRRDLRRRGGRRSTSSTSSRAVPTPSPIFRGHSSRTSSTCSPGAIRPTSSRSSVLGSCGTGPPGPSAGEPARGGSRSRTRGRSRTVGSSASSSPTAAGESASSTRRWCTRRARARPSCSARRPGGSRRSRATGCSSRLRRESPASRRSGRARASGARPSSASGSARPRASSPRSPTRRRSSGSRASTGSMHAQREPRHLPPRAGGATGVVPSDRTIVVERFRDEIGDWRVCILTPFGGRVHAPWAMALRARLRDALDLDVQSLWSDDGIASHFPDADVPPPRRRSPARAGRDRGSAPRRARAVARCTARASARTRRGRCSSRAAGRASARRSGSSA